MNAKEAKDTTVYTLNLVLNNNRLETTYNIEQHTYFDWVMKSEDLVNTSSGIQPKFFIKEYEDVVYKVTTSIMHNTIEAIEVLELPFEKNFSFSLFEKYLAFNDVSMFTLLSNEEAENWGYVTQDEDYVYQYYAYGTLYTIANRSFRNRGPVNTGDWFVNFDDAENKLFEIQEGYFFEDDTRDNPWFYTIEQAEEERLRLLSEIWEVERDVAEKLLKLQTLEREQEQIAEHKPRINREENNELAKIYAQNIEMIEGESFEETCTRFSKILGTRIDKNVFFKAVKIIRGKGV